MVKTTIGIVKCVNGQPVYGATRYGTREGHDWFFTTHKNVFEQSYYNDECTGLPTMTTFFYHMLVPELGVCKEFKFIGTAQQYEDFIAANSVAHKTRDGCNQAESAHPFWQCVGGVCTLRHYHGTPTEFSSIMASSPAAFFTEEKCKAACASTAPPVDPPAPKQHEYWRCVGGVCTLTVFEGTLSNFKTQILPQAGNFASEKDCQNMCVQTAPPWDTTPGTGFGWHPFKFLFSILKGFFGGS